MKPTEHRKGERGTQLIELAVVLPLLLFLALFVTEGAGFLRMHQALNNAAREGARLSSLQENQCKNSSGVEDTTCSTNFAIQFAVLDYLCANGVQYTSSVPAGRTCGTGPAVTVTVDQNVGWNGAQYLITQPCPAPGTQCAIVDSSIPPVVIKTTRVTVSRTYNLPLMSTFSWFGTIPSSIRLSTSARFRILY